MRKSSNSSLQANTKTLHARAICFREILLAYLCIFFIESACLFSPAWVR